MLLDVTKTASILVAASLRPLCNSRKTCSRFLSLDFFAACAAANNNCSMSQSLSSATLRYFDLSDRFANNSLVGRPCFFTSSLSELFKINDGS